MIYRTSYEEWVRLLDNISATTIRLKRSASTLPERKFSLAASRAKYIATSLSRGINSGRLSDIEGAFFSNVKLKGITFKDGSRKGIESSATGTNYDLSMFRLKH